MPEIHEEEELRSATDAILQSSASRKLVVAGPGTGKTFLFRQTLERTPQPPERRLILTFINNLRDDLDRELGSLGQVYTFHGYCRSLLHRRPELRGALTSDFHYFPPLPSLIKSDWEVSQIGDVPHFVGAMRTLAEESVDFYTDRSDYYDAVSFDDSVFRTYQALHRSPELIEAFDLVLVDEYQDFNRLEVEFINLLAQRSGILIAGDDDQALYATLRSSSPDFIRQLFSSTSFACFPLPFCMRCTEVVVGAANDLIEAARARGHLSGRIPKPYKHYPPKKGTDSARYPKLKVVQTTVQRNGTANYFGRYIAEQIGLIPNDEVTESREGRWPTVLIVGPRQYTRQVQEHLEAQGYRCEAPGHGDANEFSIDDAKRILKTSPDSNLGWRLIMEIDRQPFYEDVLRRSVSTRLPLVDLLPPNYVSAVKQAVNEWQEPPDEPLPEAIESAGPIIRITSFEGSKGLSASYVFIVGLHDEDLPRDRRNVTDIEICKLIVALTRTRKQCHILYAKRWGNTWKNPSIFLSWIKPQRIEFIKVNKDYWT